MTVVTIYGKPGCHLCDEARASWPRSSRTAFELHEVDITADPP